MSDENHPQPQEQAAPGPAGGFATRAELEEVRRQIGHVAEAVIQLADQWRELADRLGALTDELGLFSEASKSLGDTFESLRQQLPEGTAPSEN